MCWKGLEGFELGCKSPPLITPQANVPKWLCLQAGAFKTTIKKKLTGRSSVSGGFPKSYCLNFTPKYVAEYVQLLIPTTVFIKKEKKAKRENKN